MTIMSSYKLVLVWYFVLTFGDTFGVQSTWSFFPERSITLGHLIGIHSLSQSEPKRVSTILEAKRIRKEYGTPRTSAPRVAIKARTRSWCLMFLGCRGGLHSRAIGMSPSLAHFLDMERKKKCTKRPSTTNKEKHTDEHIVHNMGVVSTRESVARGDTLSDHEGI